MTGVFDRETCDSARARNQADNSHSFRDCSIWQTILFATTCFDFISKQILAVPSTCVTFTRVGENRTRG